MDEGDRRCEIIKAAIYLGEVTAPGTTPCGAKKSALSGGERVAALCRRVRGYFVPRVPAPRLGELRGAKRQRCKERMGREKTPHPPSFIRHPLPEGEGCDLQGRRDLQGKQGA